MHTRLSTRLMAEVIEVAHANFKASFLTRSLERCGRSDPSGHVSPIKLCSTR